ncbi:LysR family transcriptional regulator [Streptomyces ipomoeae]|jgi:DNA-binding transcriptional LysR family regulator|uniref:LysR substrate binding domain protein n=2 Tax=Streptomyces ipomoeae TaxID=103232 RepID=L1L029_9ACTN|nr:LysR family transcriptional regulator [Streptomyces ipomoeae]EKX66085.1 LysR substrate binding domain protein [Streptomyces ipomoeae 91-03]MDX2696441.1 LysR family transcriptional regulator [Streptomyces ipomoeae]MDX2826326.1 LysR family transcriptional regulator [Streptomyces ipomoeae]MDX2842213.1 LysR family transcriptional regulator [Streptomyces ipomoeae]TQE25171.1 LysR family transcriptional regulator [Streptomyces ipomoeae]
MELDPRRLRVLRAVALRGGVMDAAKVLHLTPSAVSQHLAQLEREVGQPLIDRSRRRVGLTPAGKLLAARAERIEQELSEARRELALLTGRATGPVAVGAFSTAVSHLLVPALGALARSHPGLRPEVVESEGPEALRELRTGGLDLLVVEYDADDPAPYHRAKDLASAPVADDEYRVVTPADWTPAPRTVRDLTDRPWVAGPPGTACRRALERISDQYGLAARRAHTCREFPTVLALVRAGLGAAVLPTLALADAPPETVALPAVPVAGHRRIAAVWRAPRSGPEPLTSALVTALQEAAVDLGLTPIT